MNELGHRPRCERCGGDVSISDGSAHYCGLCQVILSFRGELQRAQRRDREALRAKLWEAARLEQEAIKVGRHAAPSFRLQTAGRMAGPRGRRRASPFALVPCHATCSLDPESGGCASPDLDEVSLDYAYKSLCQKLSIPLVEKIMTFLR